MKLLETLNMECISNEMSADVYGMPNMGCLVGTAFQVMQSQLAAELDAMEIGITVAEYLVLRSLYYCDGMQQCEIAAMVGKDKGAVSRCVASLVSKGLVRTHPVSYKCLQVFLSSRGREIEPKILEVARKRDRELEEIVSPEELTVFKSVLKKIINTKNKKGKTQ